MARKRRLHVLVSVLVVRLGADKGHNFRAEAVIETAPGHQGLIGADQRSVSRLCSADVELNSDVSRRLTLQVDVDDVVKGARCKTVRQGCMPHAVEGQSPGIAAAKPYFSHSAVAGHAESGIGSDGGFNKD